MSTSTGKPAVTAIKISSTVILSVILLMTVYTLRESFYIRLIAIRDYGRVIHEFDPYFNFRATEYLYEHGSKAFFTWFDYKSWYPLGRPVGTTIYPGMQFTAVFIKKYIFDDLSLNDVCVFIPAWFGVLATFVTGLLAYEVTLERNCCNSLFTVLMDMLGIKKEQEEKIVTKRKKKNKKQTATKDIDIDIDIEKKTNFVPYLSAMFVMMAMAVIPAHLMRSVGGGFDNECVAMTAMTTTFYFWCRSLRAGEDKSFLWGIFTGLSYFYMAAAWGGYVFVLNMIGLHAALLVALGRFNTKIYLAYTIFYIIGTALAIQIPVVGMTPLKSLEQLGAFAVFVGYQVLQFMEVSIRNKKLSRKEAWKFRIQFVTGTAVLGIAAILIFTPTGYFGPISSRVRGLFVKHTKTGNPLVDSVAEHQPAKANAYFQYLQYFCTLAPLGFLMTLVWFGDSPSFVVAYGFATYFFSHKMVRLILLAAPAASILGGIALGRVCGWSIDQLLSKSEEVTKTDGKKKKDVKKTDFLPSWLKKVVGIAFICASYGSMRSFDIYCWKIAKHLSNPSIIQIGQLRDGSVIKVDDYREAYNWLRENTPEDARVMAWWDYGYQIASIANRTTIADGNTWNHEHIALLARILTGPTEKGYEIARHMADYMLVWAGGGGDDLAKSPHLARIANSVYRDMCSDPVCSQFGFVQDPQTRQRRPSRQMGRSLIANLVSYRIKPEAKVDPEQFQEVFKSKYGKVRIYKIMNVDKESKDWAADPSNRICDVEGGWFCRGQYPPAVLKYVNEGKTFAQLEDFNKKGYDEEYRKQYFDGLKKKDERRKAEAKRRVASKKKEEL